MSQPFQVPKTCWYWTREILITSKVQLYQTAQTPQPFRDGARKLILSQIQALISESPNSGGMRPVSKFPEKSNVVRFVRRESDLGIDPESMLLLIKRSTTTTQFPRYGPRQPIVRQIKNSTMLSVAQIRYINLRKRQR
jgi:hypothetical protein